MSGALNEALELEPVAPPTERSTGLVFAAVALIGAGLLRNSTALLAGLSLVALAFLGFSLGAPERLKRLNRAWFKLAMLMNRVVSPVVMLALYAVVIVPFGLAMQLKRDPLRKARDAACASYWIERSPPAVPACMRNQF